MQKDFETFGFEALD